MGIYDTKTHIKSTDEFKRELRKVAKFTPEEEKFVLNKARPHINTSTGMSKEEFERKVLRPLKNNTKDQINPEEVHNLERSIK